MEELSLILLMRDFYQFAPITGQTLLEKPKTKTEEHGKHLWQNLTDIITLTEQMRQQQDFRFQSLLQQACNGKLT